MRRNYCNNNENSGYKNINIVLFYMINSQALCTKCNFTVYRSRKTVYKLYINIGRWCVHKISFGFIYFLFFYEWDASCQTMVFSVLQWLLGRRLKNFYMLILFDLFYSFCYQFPKNVNTYVIVKKILTVNKWEYDSDH